MSFQASPFEPPPPAEQLYVGAEANRYGELANPSSVGGDEMLRSDGRDPRTFTGRTVLNSGVILGQLPTLLAYLDWLLASAGPWCDQGRLNAFALAFPERVAAPPLGASRFLTFDRFDLGRLRVDLGRLRVDLGRLRVDGRGLVYNCHGQLYAVLHRLDACLGHKCAAVGAVRRRREQQSQPWSVENAGFVNDVPGCPRVRRHPSGRQSGHA